MDKLGQILFEEDQWRVRFRPPARGPRLVVDHLNCPAEKEVPDGRQCGHQVEDGAVVTWSAKHENGKCYSCRGEMPSFIYNM